MPKIFFAGLVLLLPFVLFTQDRVEAPVWNVGDKWVLTEGSVEVVEVSEHGYVVKFPKATQVFDKSTLNITYVLEGDKRKEYRGVRKRLLNFPLGVGKTWEDSFKSRIMRSTSASKEHLFIE